MEIVKKPDTRVFASNAKTGEILAFPDVLRGWGVTLDQTQGKPPLEWMNDAFNRIDLNNLYLLQQGIPEWDGAIRYPVNSIIKYADKIYLCTAENENNEPSSVSDKWSLYVRNASEKDAGILKLATQAEADAGTDDTKSVTPKKLAEKLKKLPDASLTQKGITQLTNTIDISEDKAATPKGVLGYVQAELLKTVPVGTISLWGGEFAPEGYLLSRGQSFSASQYPKLAVLFPSLKLPDFRGVVPRGLDDTRGFDPGRVLGSYQEDATQKVVGNFAMSGFDPSIAVTPTGPFSISQIGGTGATGTTYAAYRATFDNSKVARTANEERMKNIAMNFIIKAG